MGRRVAGKLASRTLEAIAIVRSVSGGKGGAGARVLVPLSRRAPCGPALESHGLCAKDGSYVDKRLP